MKSFNTDLVTGNLFRSVWKLAWPLVLLNLVNGLHGFVDHLLVGHFNDSPDNAANAAIGVSWQLFLVLVVFIASIFHGMNVLIARYTGRQDRETISKVFYSSLLSSFLILTVVVAPAGYLLTPQLLRLVHVEPHVLAYAQPYLRILFLCSAPLFLLFLLAGAFHASGQPKIPLALGILTTILNVLISTVLIAGVGPFPQMGTTGAALGTVTAPMIACGLGLYLICSRRTILQPPKRLHFSPDLSIMRAVVRIGIPTGIQGVLLNLGGVLLLRYIGALEFSAAAQAAYTICYAQLFSIVTWTSFGLRGAAATFIGQNIGAGNPSRGKRGVLLAAAMGGIWACLAGIVFWSFPDSLLRLFNAVDEPLFSYGASLLRVLAFSGIALSITLSLTGGLQGAGATRAPMLIAFLTQIVILLSICHFFLLLGMLRPDTIWLAILTSHLSRLLFTGLAFRNPNWVHTRVDLESPS